MRKTPKIIFLGFVLVWSMANSQISLSKRDENNLSLLNGTSLLKTKENLNTPKFNKTYNELLESANKALKEGVFSVMQKTQTPHSGTKHDYISLGPYWWPDPTKPDGLPWIRKDGEVNPLTRKGNTDFETKRQMIHNTNVLSMAYFFSGKIQYANKALELLKVWFLNKETKMNPNLNFAQAIPGKNKGRGIGIIEFSNITDVITAIEILEMNKVMEVKTSQELRQWFSDYLHWLQTSENGIFEKKTKNNHGTHYDVQVASILLFLDRKEEVREVLESVKKRIAKQISSDGKQPHELARTKALSYSTMNLRGFTELAFIGTKVGVDLWNYRAENGASIINAYEFLKPYAKGFKTWDYKQIHDPKGSIKKLKDLFTVAGSLFNIREYCEIGKDKNGVASSLIYYCN
ncbi:hypothetical protein AXE80_06075 [Wenyingzhuangia fucanilytica]|uniref:Alginate lyase domain-containing protein n=1 Tax=Wenyingzhuangia fucanilytica TaxID=1790137 RepID=A0A1B1Y522_9FLAO|nr:alginate lyase family protein [Wenyingzhuangia fucanilytica]ANW95872.1 hypothetical protein AXE80_06075 [Wenyingzhuangia fucanilytica]